jgi:hypothetical protein
MNSRFLNHGPSCRKCKHFNENADWPNKEKDEHCYIFADWDYEEDGNHCILNFKPFHSNDTAEDNLKDNQL